MASSAKPVNTKEKGSGVCTNCTVAVEMLAAWTPAAAPVDRMTSVVTSSVFVAAKVLLLEPTVAVMMLVIPLESASRTDATSDAGCVTLRFVPERFAPTIWLDWDVTVNMICASSVMLGPGPTPKPVKEKNSPGGRPGAALTAMFAAAGAITVAASAIGLYLNAVNSLSSTVQPMK